MVCVPLGITNTDRKTEREGHSVKQRERETHTQKRVRNRDGLKREVVLDKGSCFL